MWTGYAFSCKELFMNMPKSFFKMSSKDKLKNFNTTKTTMIMCKVFFYTVWVILWDIIENKVTFKLPVNCDCYIHMRRSHGEEFKKDYRNGAFQKVDYLASNFSGFSPEFVRNRRDRICRIPIYVTSDMKDAIIEHTNKGEQYW